MFQILDTLHTLSKRFSSNFRGLALDGATRYGAFPETRLSQVRPTRGLAMSCPLIRAPLVSFHISFSLSLSLCCRSSAVYPLCKRWRPTPLALDMATPAERFKSSVRVIKRRAGPIVLRAMSRSFVFYGDLRLGSFAKSAKTFALRNTLMNLNESFVIVFCLSILIWNRVVSASTLRESGSWKPKLWISFAMYFIIHVSINNLLFKIRETVVGRERGTRK